MFTSVKIVIFFTLLSLTFFLILAPIYLLPVRKIECREGNIGGVKDLIIDRYSVFSGALHIHTFFSKDSKTPPSWVLSFAKKNSFDFLLFADHNTTAVKNIVSVSDPNIEIIIGEEKSQKGKHLLLIDDEQFISHPYLGFKDEINKYKGFEGFSLIYLIQNVGIKKILLLPSFVFGFLLKGGDIPGILYDFIVDYEDPFSIQNENFLNNLSTTVVLSVSDYHLKIMWPPMIGLPPIPLIKSLNMIVWTDNREKNNIIQALKNGNSAVAFFEPERAKDFYFVGVKSNEIFPPSVLPTKPDEILAFFKKEKRERERKRKKNAVILIETAEGGKRIKSDCFYGDAYVSFPQVQQPKLVRAVVLKYFMKFGDILIGARRWIGTNPFYLK